MKRVVIALAALSLVVGLSFSAGFVVFNNRVQAPGPGQGPLRLTVPKGASAASVGRQLQKQGLLGSQWTWRFLLKQRGGLKLKAGRFDLDKSMSLAAIADALEQSPIAEDHPLKVLEGWRLSDTDAALADQGWIQAGEYIAAAHQIAHFKAPFPLPETGLEGYLYPETYAINPQGFKIDWLIQRQLDTFVRRFYQPHAAEIKASGRSLSDLVIMASMLEREEPTPAQRSVVAGILWKRIDHDTPLGVDATSRYSLALWNDRKAFLKKLRDPDDPYNSRLRKGLPPTPIGAPTVQSLVAALRPTPGPYWYYLHDANKVLHPSRNAAEHEALRKKYQVY